MKRLFVVLLVILLTCSLLASCGTKEKIEEKAAEKIMEEALSDENAEVDIDGEKITVKGKDGEIVTIGGAEWPDIDYIPEFKKGRIISAAYDSNSAIITIEEVDQKSYDDYLEDIMKSFTDETYNMQTEDFLAFEGMNDKGEKVALQYYINDKTLTIVGNRESQ